MTIKRMLAAIAMTGALAIGAQTASAATICNGCDYLAPATYLGAHDATASDLSTFQHVFTGVPGNTPFSDYWVFDVVPAAFGSASADFTVLTFIANFSGALYADGGTICAGGPGTACGAPVLGALIATDSDPSPSRFEVFADILPGRYIILATGTTGPTFTSAYTGQVSFVPSDRFLVAEPDTLALLALGVLAMGGVALRRRV
jgi:hypothetical protein